MFLHTFQPQSIIGHLGPLTIHWYGLFLSLGALAGYLVFRRLGRSYGISANALETLFFLTIVIGLIGARLYHVTNEWAYYRAHPQQILSIWNGGLAIHGAVIAGIIVCYFFARRSKLSFWLLADITVPALAIGQAIGRWGNYFNQELFGRPTTLPWGIPIEPLNRPIQYISAKYFHPTFLYESLGSLAVFVILLLLHRRRLRQQPTKGQSVATGVGMIALVYFIAESVIRIGTELIRIDRVPLVFGVRLPLLTSVVIALAASVVLFRTLKRAKTS